MVFWIPLAAAGVTALGGIVSSALNVREAAKNRRFQERMSSTAHQREVEDLRKAGINPMMRSLGGASAPAGDRAEIRDPVGPAVSSALNAKMMQAQIRLLDAQEHKTRVEAGRYLEESNAGRFERLISERELAQLSVQEKRQMLPLLLEGAKADIAARLSSARQSVARAMLEEAARTGAVNIQKFEERLGELSPIIRNYLMLIRSLTGSLRGVIPQ